MQDKICLITGANKGIGLAIVHDLASTFSDSMKIIATTRSEQSKAELEDHLQRHQLSAAVLHYDLMQSDSHQQLLATVHSMYDCGPDILVNNAGLSDDNLLLRMKEEQWRKVLSANLDAPYRLCKAVLRDMLRKRWGRIVNISSVCAYTGNGGQANYSAAKAGMVALTKSLAQEVAKRGITANCICPGIIETAMTAKLTAEQQQQILTKVPMARMGKVAEVAHAVRFLLDENAGYITGSCLHVNGGLVML